MKKYNKSDLMNMCKEGIDKYYYNGNLTPLQGAEKYFFEQTNNQYPEGSDTYELYAKCFCEYGKEICRRNGYELIISEVHSS